VGVTRVGVLGWLQCRLGRGGRLELAFGGWCRGGRLELGFGKALGLFWGYIRFFVGMVGIGMAQSLVGYCEHRLGLKCELGWARRRDVRTLWRILSGENVDFLVQRYLQLGSARICGLV
jgi:hypothetical protein